MNSHLTTFEVQKENYQSTLQSLKETEEQLKCQLALTQTNAQSLTTHRDALLLENQQLIQKVSEKEIEYDSQMQSLTQQNTIQLNLLNQELVSKNEMLEELRKETEKLNQNLMSLESTTEQLRCELSTNTQQSTLTINSLNRMSYSFHCFFQNLI